VKFKLLREIVRGVRRLPAAATRSDVVDMLCEAFLLGDAGVDQARFKEACGLLEEKEN